MTPETISLIFAFLVGAVVGSFLNVVIYRVPRGMSIVSPPSRCSSCEKPIRWYHNIPIVSYALLRGKCAHCGAPFDLRYPMVELVTAVLAVACVSVFGLNLFAVRAFVFVAILISLTYIDLEHWLLPHVITWPAIALGLLTPWVAQGPGWTDAAIGAAAGFAGFWLLRVIASAILKKEALGGGDLWLLALIGAFLGWQALLPVVFLASVQGSVVGIAVMLIHGAKEGGEEAAEGEGAEAAATSASGEDAQTAAEPASESGAATGAASDAQKETAAVSAAEFAPESDAPDAATGAASDAQTDADTTTAASDAEAPDLTTTRAEESPEEEDLQEKLEEEDTRENLEDDWSPPPNAVPFGPFLSLAALQMLFLGELVFDLIHMALGTP